LDIRVNEHRRNWLKLDREREEGDEAATSSLLESHAAEHNHQVNWEEVTILVKESNTRNRKIHEAAAMHIFFFFFLCLQLAYLAIMRLRVSQ
jgi:L-rhamnose mutarotase